MNRKTQTLVVCGLGIGVLFGGTYTYRQLQKNADLARSATLESRRLEQQIGRLAEQFESLPVQQQYVPLLVQQGKSAPESDAEKKESVKSDKPKSRQDEGPPTEHTQEEANLRRDAHYALVDSVLKSEARDPGWARATEARVAERIRSYPAVKDFKLTETTCASTLCKFEGTLADKDDLGAIHEVMLGLGFSTETMIRLIEDGSGGTRVVAYFSREDRSLPRSPE